MAGSPGIGKDGKDGPPGKDGVNGSPGASGPRGATGAPGYCDPSDCIGRPPPLYMMNGGRNPPATGRGREEHKQELRTHSRNTFHL